MTSISACEKASGWAAKHLRKCIFELPFSPVYLCFTVTWQVLGWPTTLSKTELVYPQLQWCIQVSMYSKQYVHGTLHFTLQTWSHVPLQANTGSHSCMLFGLHIPVLLQNVQQLTFHLSQNHHSQACTMPDCLFQYDLECLCVLLKIQIQIAVL